MGIASALFGENNPFSQWVDQNQNFLGAIGAGLGQGQNIQSGLGAGLSMLPQAKQLDRAAAEKLKADKLAEQQANATTNWLQQNHPDLAQMVTAGMPVSEAWNEAMKRMQPQGGLDPTSNMQDWQFGQENPGYWDALHPGQSGGSQSQDIQEYEYARTNGYEGSFMEWMTRDKGSGTKPPLGTTIYTGRDASGNIIPLQAGQGEFVTTKLPDGIAFDPGAMTAEKTGAAVDAKTAGAARAALPGAEQAVSIAKNAINLLRNDEKGLNEQFGQVGPRNMFVLPGSALGNWQANFKQADGQAFMQARQMLKGGGPITDYEGMKGEAAYSRMRAAVEMGDKQNFLLALQDFEDAVNQGYQKLAQTAGGGYSKAPPSVPAQLSNGNQTSSGVQWSVEP